MEQFYFLFFKILCPIRVIFHNFNFHDSFVLASKTMFGIILHISPVQGLAFSDARLTASHSSQVAIRAFKVCHRQIVYHAAKDKPQRRIIAGY